jgi:hypothetical protein
MKQLPMPQSSAKHSKNILATWLDMLKIGQQKPECLVNVSKRLILTGERV